MEALLLTHGLFNDLWKGLETYIGFGFTPWRGVRTWVPDVARMTNAPRQEVEARLHDLWVAQQQEQETWTYTTDGDRLDAAFAQLRERGIYTAAAWGCCLECHANAPAPVPDDAFRGEAVVHGFAAPMMTHGILPIAYGNPSWSEWDTEDETYMEVGNLVVGALREQGLVVAWDAKPGAPIDVLTSDWKQRMPDDLAGVRFRRLQGVPGGGA